MLGKVIAQNGRKKEYCWGQLLCDMREWLSKNKFTQVPQLSASYKISLAEDYQVYPPGYRARKALLIGINYVGHQKGVLSGCHNDVNSWKNFLVQHGYQESDITVLMDDGTHTMPTRANIEKEIRNLVKDVKAQDALFLQYSGHGTQIRDTSGDEASGYDQALCPVDYQSSGLVIDDWIVERLAELPAGCDMLCVMDCCHSGSVCDLPFEVRITQADVTASIDRRKKTEAAQLSKAEWEKIQKQKDELKKRQEDLKSKEKEFERKQQELQWKLDDIQKQMAEASSKEEETRLKEEELRRKEEQQQLKEDQLKHKQEMLEEMEKKQNEVKSMTEIWEKLKVDAAATLKHDWPSAYQCANWAAKRSRNEKGIAAAAVAGSVGFCAAGPVGCLAAMCAVSCCYWRKEVGEGAKYAANEGQKKWEEYRKKPGDPLPPQPAV